jgi:hypothetical protein
MLRTELLPIEAAAIQGILDELDTGDRIDVAKQISAASIKERTNTELGFYLDLSLPSSGLKPVGQNVQACEAVVNVAGTAEALRIFFHVSESGYIQTLEGYPVALKERVSDWSTVKFELSRR